MPTPLGYVDHRPFAGLGARLIFGRRPDGSVVRVEHVSRGLACDCICPAVDCAQPLIASKGEKVAHHFRHASGAEGCRSGAETNAHIWAKQVLEQEQAIWLPEIQGTARGVTVTTHPRQRFQFDGVRLETRRGEIVPDVVLSKGTRELIVEVHVTHACDTAKITKLEAAGTSALEVDLRAYRTCEDEAQVREAMLVTAPRRWLVNPKLADAQAAARARAMEIDAEKRRAAETAAVDLRRRLLEAPKMAEVPYQPACELTEALGLGRLLEGPEPVVSGFAVSTRVWRAAVIERVVLPATAPGHPWWRPTVDVGQAAEKVRDLWALPFRPPTPAEVLQALACQPMPIVHPADAVRAFIESLAQEGILVLSKGVYTVLDKHRRLLRDEGKAIAERQRRAGAIADKVDAILSLADPDELSGFQRDLWMRTPPAGFAQAPSALIHDGGEAFDRFEGLLSRLEPSPWRRSIPTDTMGLPIGRHLEREAQRARSAAEAAEAAKKAAAVEGRLGRLERVRTYAVAVLGLSGDAWLAAVSASAQTSRLEIAAASDEGYERVRRAIDQVADDRQVAQQNAEAMARRQLVLRRRAAAVLDETTAAFFLDNPRNELGRLTPLRACSSDRGLAAALALLPKSRRR
jgi:hypothetical protein